MGKSSRHKSENTFRFQTFSERIASINIDVIHQIKHHDDTPEDVSTYFWDALEKHSELNCTEHFINFHKEISKKVRTITQLVHHEEAIVTALKKHLMVPDSMALHALMDLVVALARDLQKDFYPQFHAFFDILVQLLRIYSQNVEILEQTFTCLSYLFKFLWRYLVKDIQSVYEYFSSLLSQKYKEHIRNFAAESFAFLMRKVKDHSELFEFLFGTLKDHPEKSEGLGRLLFEMMKGVKHQFHSSSVKIFPVLLDQLGPQEGQSDSSLPWEHVETTFSSMLGAMMQHADTEHMEPMVDIFMEALKNNFSQYLNSKKKKKKATMATDTLIRFLRLARQIVEFKKATVITKPDNVGKMLIELLQERSLPECVAESLLAMSSSLIVKCSTKMEVQVTIRLISTVFKSSFPAEDIYGFVRRLFNMPLFEKDVLPHLLTYCDRQVSKSTESHDSTLLLITELLLHKSPLPQHGGELEDTETYMLDFGVKSKLPDMITSMMREVTLKKDRHSLIKFWFSLVCAPHVRPARHDGLKEIVAEFVTNCLFESQVLDSDICFILTQVVVAMVMIEDNTDIFSVIPSDLVFECLPRNSSNVYFLRFVDMYLSHAAKLKVEDLLTESNFKRIFPMLQQNLSSPKSMARMFTLRILTQFKFPLPESDVEVQDVLTICLYAEMVPATVQTYRDKLRYLQKLEHADIQKCMPNESLQQVPLRYLIGCLFINFKLLWQPVLELITSHAHGMEKTEFWKIFGKHLSEASERCREEVYEDSELTENEMEDNDSLRPVFSSSMDEVVYEHQSPDFNNFRIQLWKGMNKFPEKCEPKSKVFVPLFFDFLRLEYYNVEDNQAPSQNILREHLDNALSSTATPKSQDKRTNEKNIGSYRNSKEKKKENGEIDDVPDENETYPTESLKSALTVTSHLPGTAAAGRHSTVHRPYTRSQGKVEDMEEDSSDEEEEFETVDVIDDEETMVDDEVDVSDEQQSKQSKTKKRTTARGKVKKAVIGALLIQLEVFAKFKNPKSICRESELRELYFDFLLHRHPQVQKAAFNCILSYKDKYLMPYKDNFSRLLDDKTFKNELVCFSIDDENSVIDPTHRQDVLPLLMRILHGKMRSKTGMGKVGMGVRQSIVLRFLNGCREDELQIFIDLVFKPFQDFISNNLFQKVKEIRTTIDLSKVVTIKKMQGVMSSAEMILKKLGHLIDSYLPHIIQIIVGLGTVSSVCLEKRDQIVLYVLSPLKSVRQMAISRITQIFVDYKEYEWSPMEIDAIFEGMVWHRLEKLSVDGFDSPNPILRFFQALSKNPRYFPLLAQHHENDVNCTPLVHVIKLLSHKDVSKSVTSVVLEMVDNLLNDTYEHEDFPPIAVNHMLNLDQDCPMGRVLLQPHVNDVLIYLEKAMKTLFTKQNRKQENFVELDVLSRISGFVTDPELCKTTISLLLPFLYKKKAQKAEEDILSSIENLLKLVDDRAVFIPTVCRLFASLVQKNSRVLLSKVFWIICEGNTELQNLAEIIQQLNSFDSKRVDEPDYLNRLNGYRRANELVKSMTTIDENMCVALLNNCCHMINMTEDMSLRDASTNCIVTIVSQFGRLGYEECAYKTVIDDCLLQEVKFGLRNRLEVVRHEYVVVLISLIDTFGEIEPFNELKPLRDSDLEADFYENIKHIQLHKRSRGMQRLIRHLHKHMISPSTLLTYFLPLVSSFLTDHYKKHNALQDTAVTAYGVICHKLPWKQYYQKLEYYIQLIPKRPESQRLIVRVIVSILDAFHFDLTNSTYNMKLAPDAAIEEDKKTDTQDIPEIEDIQTVDITLDSDDEDKEVEAPELNEITETTPLWGRKRVQVCSEELATEIHFIISQKVIFQLRKILVQKMEADKQHKVNKSKFAEDDEILRVPIALAMVKLLQHLPEGALERFLPGVLLKVCNFLRSKSIDIRTTARDTLVKIQKSLGTRYFPFLLSELQGCLLKGYQRHVLCYTIHMLLVHISEKIQPGDIDVCLTTLQEILNEEIFGDMSEEKEVQGITVKLMEAKSSKSFDSYKLIATHITKSALMKLMTPLKEILDSTHSSKVANKVQTVLKTIVLGLVENKHLTLEHLLVFVHGLVSETLPMLVETKNTTEEEEKSDNLLEKKPEHSLLLQTEMPRGGFKPKASKRTNLHVLVEFGLEILNSCKKRQKINTHDSQHLEMLDPLVPLLKDCLYSKYAKVNAFTLRNLRWMMKIELPSLKENINEIANGMFILLRSSASPGTAKGDNTELLSMLFKAVTVLVRDVKLYKIKTERLEVLLTFCEEDLYDYNRQSTAFSLLKAIMSRKRQLVQIDEMVKKIEEMSITADAPHVRRECRQVVIQYLLDFPLGKKIEKHVEFYISQLSYELESGRESALEMMATFFTSFPQEVLAKYASLFFIPMSANLVNDESAKCRKLTALALKSLLTNLDNNNRTNMFSFVMKWFNNSNLSNRSLASQLCGLFVEVEGQKFETRLAELLPVIEQQLEPGKYSETSSDTTEQAQDHMIYNTLNTLLKILTECNFLVSDKKWTASMNLIWEYVQHYLTYPHLWIQLVSSQLFGILFVATQPDQIFSWQSEDGDTPYLMKDSLKKLQTLAQAFTSQLQSELLNEDLANQVVKNMVFLGKCAKHVYKESKEEREEGVEEDDEDVETNNIFTLPWLVRKMVREAHFEAIHKKREILKRSSVFKWIAAVSLDLGEEVLTSVLRSMLPPLQREIEDASIQNAALKTLAQEVVELLKKTVGVETFTDMYANTQKERTERKEDRKRKRAVEVISDPEVAARRKIKKHLAKVDAKKRKIAEKRPSKVAKKRRYEEFIAD